MIFVSSSLLVFLLSLTGAEAFTRGQYGSRYARNNNLMLQQSTTPKKTIIVASSFHDRLLNHKDDSASTRIRMSMRSSQNDDETASIVPSSISYTVALAILLGFALFVAPGSFGSDADNAMLQAYMDNPASPTGLNVIFNTEFNLLGIIPIVMACLLFPQAAATPPDGGGGLPLAPFVAASAALGYFGLGTCVCDEKRARYCIESSCSSD